MKRVMRNTAMLLALCGLGGLLQAKTLYYGGDIVTMQGAKPHYVEAVVEDEGRIHFAGKKAEAQKLLAEEDRSVNLAGRTMLPAFFDPHGHLLLTTLLVSYADLNAPPIGKVDSIAKLQETLLAYKKEHNLGENDWIIGMNYDDTGMKEQRHPTRADLDAVSKTNPIYIMHSSSHFGVANSKALELADITDSVKDPKGGKFYRDEKGHLTGVMEEGPAFTQVMMKITPVAPEVAMRAIRKTLMSKYAAEGMTTVQECGGALPDFVKLLQAMAKQKMLPVDVIAYPNPDNTALLSDYNRTSRYDNHFRMGGLKVIMDGSIQGYTAYLSKPYFVVPKELEPSDSACDSTYKAPLLLGDTNATNHEHHTPSASLTAKGFVSRPSYKQEELEKIVDHALKEGWHLMVHCNGDGAIDMLLEAMEKTTLPEDHRTTIVHAQTIREDQLEKVKKLGMDLTLFPSHIYYWGDRHATKFLGPKRAAQMNPMRSVIDRGIPYTIHHDSPVTPTSIIDMIAFAVNRTTLGGKVLGEDQAMTPYEALKSVTINAAWQHKEEKEKGTLEVGKEADFVILSANPLKVKHDKLQQIKVLETINDGEVIYERKK
jgi:predicted amidohydrolase YtcJ